MALFSGVFLVGALKWPVFLLTVSRLWLNVHAVGPHDWGHMGEAMWGTWWVWDARLTSEAILAFLFLAYILMGQILRDQPSCKGASLFCIDRAD